MKASEFRPTLRSALLSYGRAAVRILTGAALATGSVQYILSQADTMLRVEQAGLDFIAPTFLVPLITLAQLVGGAMLVFGLLTRAAAAIQIPVFILFLFFREFRVDIPGLNYPVWFDVAILIAILLFTVSGSGPFSLDRYLRERQFRDHTETLRAMSDEDYSDRAGS